MSNPKFLDVALDPDGMFDFSNSHDDARVRVRFRFKTRGVKFPEFIDVMVSEDGRGITVHGQHPLSVEPVATNVAEVKFRD